MKVETIFCDICGDEIGKNATTYTDLKLSPRHGNHCHQVEYKDVCNPCTLLIVDFINNSINQSDKK